MNSPDQRPAVSRSLARPLMVPIRLGRQGALTAFRSSNAGLLALAVVVGAGAGGGAIVFRWLIKTFTLLFTGHADYAGLGPVKVQCCPAAGAFAAHDFQQAWWRRGGPRSDCS